MHTTLKRKLTNTQMVKLFHSELINIRSFERLSPIEPQRYQKVYFNIIVRHNEGEDVKELFKRALKELN